MEFVHKSILLDEVIENLNIREDGCYVDGTLGGAGHSYQICTHLGEKGRLVGIDQDADAIQAATKRLEPYKDNVSIVRSKYVNYDNVLDAIKNDTTDFDFRMNLAYKAFSMTGAYDAMISRYFADQVGDQFPDTLNLS